jgi:hypothetical protein
MSLDSSTSINFIPYLLSDEILENILKTNFIDSNSYICFDSINIYLEAARSVMS